MNHVPDNSLKRCFTLPDDAATQALGERLAQVLQPGMTIWLVGDLGAGKTTLVRGVLRGLHFMGRVKSPTFTLVETYSFSSFNLYHFDLYRFTDPMEWEDAGFRECFGAHSVCLVEWPEKGQGMLPEPDLSIQLDIPDDGRIATLYGLSTTGKQCIEALETGD